MPTDEVALIISKIDDLRSDVHASKSDIMAELRDIRVVQDEHSERIVKLETKAPAIQWGKVLGIGAGGGGIVSIPWVVETIRGLFTG